MKVAIFGKKIPQQAANAVDTLLTELRQNRIEFLVNAKLDEQLKELLPSRLDYAIYHSQEEIGTQLDFLITIGGDGTILDAVYYVADSEVPIIGFNTGRLGFLANNAKENAVELVRLMKEQKYQLEKRSLLELSTKNNLFGDHNFALNELTVHKKDSSSMMTIHTYINDDYLNSYWADGLIVATPTGSTAYSLSCGGPIMIPQSENFVINPIAPHNLSARPIIVSDNVEIKLEIEGREEEFLATLDSRSKSISNETELVIRKANFSINLVQFEGQNFFKTIRNKLMWGLDKRN